MAKRKPVSASTRLSTAKLNAATRKRTANARKLALGSRGRSAGKRRDIIPTVLDAPDVPDIQPIFSSSSSPVVPSPRPKLPGSTKARRPVKARSRLAKAISRKPVSRAVVPVRGKSSIARSRTKKR